MEKHQMNFAIVIGRKLFQALTACGRVFIKNFLQVFFIVIKCEYFSISLDNADGTDGIKKFFRIFIMSTEVY